MKALVVGGTGFLGSAIASELVARGHQTFVLSRGQTDRTVAGTTAIHADRFGDLTTLKDHVFDWVFDTCAYAPDAVDRLAGALGNQVQRYVLISSISAYGRFDKKGITEDDAAPEANADDLALAAGLAPGKRASAFSYGSSYGPLKKSCELAATARFGARATALRVGLLVGAGDYTDRLTWWARRIDQAHGNRSKVPAPAPYDRSVQFIDVRDVADFACQTAENRQGGTWNVSGRPMQLGDLLATISRVAQSSAELVWISETAIEKAGIAPWSDIPLMSPMLPSFQHFLDVSCERAFGAGLRCRDIEDTLSGLLEWDRNRREIALKCGMSPQQEAVLLAE